MSITMSMVLEAVMVFLSIAVILYISFTMVYFGDCSVSSMKMEYSVFLLSCWTRQWISLGLMISISIHFLLCILMTISL